MAPRTQEKWTAMQAAVTMFKAIDGDGFRSNLEGRVYSRFLTPQTQPDILFPWGFFLQSDSASEYAELGNGATRTWRGTGLFFFSEDADTNPLESAAAQRCHEFEDDVWTAVKADPTLGGTVARCQVISIESEYGVTSDYAEVKVVLEFEQPLDV